MSFQNQTVIVTGAGSGLGKAIAKAFAHAGANTVLFDLNKSRLDTTISELQAVKLQSKVVAVEGSVTSEEDIQKAINEAKSLGNGRLDVHINCAGVMDRIEPVGELERDVWDHVIGVNLTGTYIATRLAVNTILAQEPAGGCILNVASIAGVKGGTAGAAYTASKHGMLGLTKNTAAYYAKQGIRCNAILPGGMDTNISGSVLGGIQTIKAENYAVVQSNMAMQPAMCDVGEVAKTVLAICGEAGGMLNGACIPVDNGWTAN
ncbi:MAG: hypothetical protein Q9162_002263 [Coniocarpon cinnabarinum]